MKSITKLVEVQLSCCYDDEEKIFEADHGSFIVFVSSHCYGSSAIFKVLKNNNNCKIISDTIPNESGQELELFFKKGKTVSGNWIEAGFYLKHNKVCPHLTSVYETYYVKIDYMVK